MYTGNCFLDDIIEVARIMRLRFCVKLFVGIVKEIFGMVKFVGCIVEGEDLLDV